MITNYGGNCDFGMILWFGLIWKFCYTDEYIFDFMILGDSITLLRYMVFQGLGC